MVMFIPARLFGDGDLNKLIIPLAILSGAIAALVYTALATVVFFVACKNEAYGYVAAMGFAALILFMVARVVGVIPT